MPKLYHISEEENIQKFVPRISKKLWNFEKYVWAIEAKKLHNYLLPRDCPRICINLTNLNAQFDWLPINNTAKAVIFVPENWKESILNCVLFKYEFRDDNFKSIDQIAGYYVSDQVEIPIGKIVIKNCLEELDSLNVQLSIIDKANLIDIKQKVVNNLKEFSIIRWKNLK